MKRTEVVLAAQELSDESKRKLKEIVLYGKYSEIDYVDNGGVVYKITYPAERNGSVERVEFRYKILSEDMEGRYEVHEKAVHHIKWIKQAVVGLYSDEGK